MREISIHASREGSDIDLANMDNPTQISIHASREGSDHQRWRRLQSRRNFNPRFPRGKRLYSVGEQTGYRINFNPRFPRGKRQPNRFGRQALTYISIHASREGSDRFLLQGLSVLWISIHASREGSDSSTTRPESSTGGFQSTLPAREATYL